MSDTLTLHETGETIAIHDGPKTAAIMSAVSVRNQMKPHVIAARGDEGVGTWGMYVEVLQGNVGVGTIHRHTRYFVYQSSVYASTRTNGQEKFGNWQERPCKSIEHALNIVQLAMIRTGAEIYGRVILVEMKADDISAVENGQVPGARYRGQHRVERDFGKYSFGGDVRNAEMPDSMKSRLIGK